MFSQKRKRLFFSTLVTALEAVVLSYQLSVLLSPDERFNKSLSRLLFVPLFLLPFPLFLKNWLSILVISICISICEITTGIFIAAKAHVWWTFIASMVLGGVGIFLKYTVRTIGKMDGSSYLEDPEGSSEGEGTGQEIRNINNQGRGVIVEIDPMEKTSENNEKTFYKEIIKDGKKEKD
jgi:hypothetical protein